jgi:glycoprotein endo-alpha-1,2-mannosidase
MSEVSTSLARHGARATLLLAAASCLVAGCTPLSFGLAHPTAAAKPAAKPAVSAPALTAAHLARFRVQIRSTSDWTTVQIPGAIKVAAQKLGVVDAGTNLKTLDDGWNLNSKTSGGTRSVDTDVVAQRTSDGVLPLRIQKGYNGVTTVTITNTTTTAKTVGTWTDSTHSSTDPSNTTTTPLTGTAVFGTTELALPKAEGRKLVLAFYYPWWSSYTESTLADKPANPCSVYSPAAVDSMTTQARSNGIDGFIVSWAGDTQNGYAFDLALTSAGKTHGYAVPYLEALQAPDAATLTTWLRQALTRSSNTAFLKSGGKPVVFVFGMSHYPAATWQSAITAVGGNVRLVGDTTDPAYKAVAWGVHRYSVTSSPDELTGWSKDTALHERAPSALDSSISPRLVAGTVSPGYDDSRLRGNANPVVPRAAGTRYSATWDAALAGQPDWVLVTSWNEWYEGTSVEPGTTNGDLALRQTSTLSTQWKNAS